MHNPINFKLKAPYYTSLNGFLYKYLMSCEWNMKFNLHLGNVMLMFFHEDSYVSLMNNFYKQGFQKCDEFPFGCNAHKDQVLGL